MADDSVPLPYPNLKVTQYQFQIQSVPRLHEQASSSFWKAVEEDGKSNFVTAISYTHSIEMAPYLEYIESDKTDLIKSLKEKNDKQLSEFEDKLKGAEENQGESEISALLRSKAMYLARIGDKACVVWHRYPWLC